MKFNEHDEFKPSDVIEGLNEFYRKVGERRRFEAKYGLSTPAAGPFLIIKRRCGSGLTTTFYEPAAIEEAITWLREECDIFYTPGLTWDDLKYKLPDKACEKEFGTTDIREMYPECRILCPRGGSKTQRSMKQFERALGLKPIKMPWEKDEKSRKIWISSAPCFHDDAWTRREKEKVMNYCMNDVICSEALMPKKEWLEGKEALEGLRTLYYAVATKHERALRRLDECLNDDRGWPETSYMLEYIRKRVETAEENVEYLCKENDSLRDQVANLKDLINHIHEETEF